MNLKSIKETCLYVSDVHRSHEFYHGLLNLETISLVPKRHVFFRLGDGVLLCFDPETTQNETRLPSHYAHGKQHIAFEVEVAAYEDWKIYLKEKGIPITHEQTWNGGVKSFYFNDPDENVLEIVQPGLWDNF